jgi:hypothetical protein
MTAPLTPTTQADDLRALAAFLDRHPQIRLSGGDRLYAFANTPEELATFASILARGAPIGSVEKNFASSTVTVARAFGPAVLCILASRSQVCEQVVTGTEVVEVADEESEEARTVEELEAALAAARSIVPTKAVEREVYGWECAPILSRDRLAAPEQNAAGIAASKAAALAHYGGMAEEAAGMFGAGDEDVEPFAPDGPAAHFDATAGGS